MLVAAQRAAQAVEHDRRLPAAFLAKSRGQAARPSSFYFSIGDQGLLLARPEEGREDVELQVAWPSISHRLRGEQRAGFASERYPPSAPRSICALEWDLRRSGPLRRARVRGGRALH
eukprot:4559074-Pyramimonas_sp.AAC.1